MTELMRKLRRSPRTLLERDGHPGPGPGRLALVMSRAGVGKTAFLVGIGLDSLLSGQKVLHISRDRVIDRVVERYNEILHELMKGEMPLGSPAALAHDLETRRHVHTFLGSTFCPERLDRVIDLLKESVNFDPDVIIIDRMDIAAIDVDEFESIRNIAEKARAEVWMSCRTHRDDPPAEPGHLPPPACDVEHLVDLVLRLDPEGDQVRLHALKDHDRMLDDDMRVGLDPHTLLLVPMFRPTT
jgi:hypothetical protein